MCGRFSLGSISEAVQKLYNTQNAFEYFPRYNISPGQQILAIRSDGKNRTATSFTWGLIPAWAKDKSISYRMINARGETVAEKPSFRSAYKSRRCLIPTDGFYEWKKEDRVKQPYYFRQVDGGIFSFAGIWESWTDTKCNQIIESCSIITTAANKLVAPIHHRMPVLISPEEHEEWLNGDSSLLLRILKSHEWPNFEVYPTTIFVNNARNEGAICIEPKLPD